MKWLYIRLKDRASDIFLIAQQFRNAVQTLSGRIKRNILLTEIIYAIFPIVYLGASITTISKDSKKVNGICEK